MTLGILMLMLFGMSCNLDTKSTVSGERTIHEMFPLVIMDSDTSEIVFETPPERIVALDSDSVEILFAIGEGERLVATHDFVSYPPEADNIARVGTAFELNLEQIVEIEPDLVYLFYDRFRPELEALGLRVLYINTLNSDITGTSPDEQNRLAKYSYEFFITYTPDPNGNTDPNGNPLVPRTKQVTGTVGSSIAESASYKTGGTSMATYYTIFSCGKGENDTIVPLEAVVTLTK